MVNDKLLPIYVVDDNPIDRLLMKRVMQEAGFENEILFLESGERLLERLNWDLEQGEITGVRKLPGLIFLDLNMPLMDGHEILKHLKRHYGLRRIPVIIFTNSTNPVEVTSVYKQGASAFLTKPTEYRDMVSLMKLTRSLWVDTIRLP